MFKPKGPFCQSCGMPMSEDPGQGGTDATGAKTTEYCSKCYQQGQFTDPSLTLDQMKEKVKSKMKEMHIPGFMANWFMKDMASLKRWSSQ